ncbi:Phosphoribosylaminoimidazole carboxylase catalytic subunit [Pyrodictium delaneyi]|uniref:N5-carboxyaminoimidazole ribonucleotide mutase n=1 Tax=Pyrodictium delaneyi TaxID=1273541 RepID=A0A0N7JD05_9CREN|nr:5-(carboxyamino)imidazole ribonucleotide mutase [Pyrodictium delaneyi]ALL00849.1 Phosphoribosylaminoimidazole carboxylase catalytic subunit [Pyrodictium delaneyi]OWJ55523.1 5-(carboxyamino)imidazole ribonucleotide mutase [Pyrodictium delaneyi]
MKCKGRVAIVIGSKSDLEYAERAEKVLREAGVETEVRVLSAHRDPEALDQYIKENDGEIDVYIAMAGLSAALPGYIASRTDKPVIGVPIPAGPLKGVDALLSIVQMPRGVPVAGVGIGAAENAALLALRILRVAGKCNG